jgi:hypothetical protein
MSASQNGYLPREDGGVKNRIAVSSVNGRADLLCDKRMSASQNGYLPREDGGVKNRIAVNSVNGRADLLWDKRMSASQNGYLPREDGGVKNVVKECTGRERMYSIAGPPTSPHISIRVPPGAH